MLSKSQAKAFFLTMTAGFSAVFLGLTVDTIRQVPARSHADLLTPDVVRGKEIWEQHNCMGCHTLLGEGAYYAPELTKVVDRRGAVWMKAFLKDPEAMYPGRRRMVNYHFTDEQTSDLVAFFTWVGNIDTNGFPAPHDLAPKMAAVAPVSLDSAPKVVTTVCVGCHAVGGKGGNVGPALDGVAGRFDAQRLDAWLKDPTAVKPVTAMPNLHLDDQTRADVVAWLLTLH